MTWKNNNYHQPGENVIKAGWNKFRSFLSRGLFKHRALIIPAEKVLRNMSSQGKKITKNMSGQVTVNESDQKTGHIAMIRYRI